MAQINLYQHFDKVRQCDAVRSK